MIRVAVFMVAAICAALVGQATLSGAARESILAFEISHFAVNYQALGFVPRGLVGSLLDIAPTPDSVEQVDAASAFMLAAVIAAATGFLALAASRAPMALLVAFAVSPATFQNFGFDPARFDQIGFILMLASLAGLMRGTVIPACVAAVVGILVHEAFAMMFLPVIVAVGFRLNLRRWAAPGVMGAAASLLVSAASPSPDAVRSFFAAFGPDYYPVRIWTMSFGENIDYAVRHLSHRDTLTWAIAPAAAFLAVTAGIVAREVLREDPRWGFVAVSALSPLLLSIAGIDLARWTAIAALNLFVVATLVLRRGSARLWLLVALGAAGPIGVAWAFPAWLPGPG